MRVLLFNNEFVLFINRTGFLHRQLQEEHRTDFRRQQEGSSTLVLLVEAYSRAREVRTGPVAYLDGFRPQWGSPQASQAARRKMTQKMSNLRVRLQECEVIRTIWRLQNMISMTKFQTNRKDHITVAIRPIKPVATRSWNIVTI